MGCCPCSGLLDRGHMATYIFSVIEGVMHLNGALGHHEVLDVTYNHNKQVSVVGGRVAVHPARLQPSV